MVKSFYVSRFKGLKEVQLNDLTRINVFVGNMASGKSSILQSIMLYLSKNAIPSFFKEAGIRGLPTSIFPNYNVGDFTLRASYEGGVKDTAEHHVSFMDGKWDWKVNGDTITEHDLVLPFSFYEPNQADSPEKRVEHFHLIKENGCFNIFLHLLKNIDYTIQDVFVKDGELLIQYNSGTMPFDWSGTGIKRFYRMFVSFFEKPLTPYFSEYPDTGLHPGFFPVIAYMLCKRSKGSHRQLFLTTHQERLIENLLSQLIMVNRLNDLTVFRMNDGIPERIEGEKALNMTRQGKTII